MRSSVPADFREAPLLTLTIALPLRLLFTSAPLPPTSAPFVLSAARRTRCIVPARAARLPVVLIEPEIFVVADDVS